jgi:hypothetical protein
MIIAFYPGAGGNRYYHYLQGLKDFVPNKTYDYLLQSQDFAYRYLDQDSAGLPDQDLILTHCVNVQLLRQLFPDHKDIHLIMADLDTCIQRE